jgi:hypothetical protein
MSKSPLAFVVDHLDNCERCSVGDFCATGIQLMHRGSEVAATLLVPIPDIPRSKNKA